jgi:hypothetical protein
VTVRGSRWDPAYRVRHAVFISDVAAEDAKCCPIVMVRVFVCVCPVNPTDDFLGCFAAFKGVCQATDLFGYPNTVAQQFFVPIIGVLGAAEKQGVREGE